VALMSREDLGETGPPGANPEQLFAAGYSSCFLNTLKYVAEERSLALDERTSVKAAVGIGKRGDGEGFGLDIALTVELAGVAPDVAHGLIAKAHVVCPYSHLARNGLEVRTSLAA
jgi:osmotically inducible protein OsmC